MSPSPEALERLLTRVPPEDRARGYVFQAVLEHVRLRGGDDAARRCLEVSGVEEPVAFFKYPVAPLLRLLHQATWELMGSSSFEATMSELGRQVCEHFLKTPVGRSFLVMVGNNPRQLVESLPVAYRTGWDHGHASLHWMGPQRCLATLHESVVPAPYLEGTLHRLFETVGVIHPRITSQAVSPSETEFDLSWG